LIFAGLDSKFAPPNVTINGGTGADTFTLRALNGGVTTATNAVIDYNSGNITAGAQTITGAAGLTFELIEFLVSTTNLTFHSFNGDVLSPGPTNGDGISRQA